MSYFNILSQDSQLYPWIRPRMGCGPRLVWRSGRSFLKCKATKLLQAKERICAEWRLDALRGPKGVPGERLFTTETQRRRENEKCKWRCSVYLYLCASVVK